MVIEYSIATARWVSIARCEASLTLACTKTDGVAQRPGRSRRDDRSPQAL
jgi:hypothetical protein